MRGLSDSESLRQEYNHALTTPQEASEHSAIYGFTPEEALADAHFQIAMLQSNHDELEDRHESAKRELQAVKASKHQWEEAFKESEIDRENLAREIELHRSIIHQLRAENEELRATKPTLPSALELLNEVLKRRKASKIREADIEVILEILGEDNEPK